VKIKETLHLKSGAAFLDGGNLVVSGEMVNMPEFCNFNRIIIPEDEQYAANCLFINNRVLIAKGYSKTRKMIDSLDYEILELDMSEYKKVDGGLSCLSLRF
jgi:dimethylargininase